MIELLTLLGACAPLSADALPQPAVRPLKDWRTVPALKNLHRAFEFLESTKFDDKPVGKYPIDGDNIYAMVTEKPTTGGAGNFEVHRRYIDVHYLVGGAETIGSTALSKLTSSKPYDPGEDAELFVIPKEYQRLVVSPGQFAVFFPGQPHLPARDLNGPHQIRKAVVKVLAAAVMKG